MQHFKYQKITKINKGTQALNDTIDQTDLIFIRYHIIGY